MSQTLLNFKVNALRTIASPYKTKENESTCETIYYLLVDMIDIPENIPLDVNPREPKMSTSVAKKLVAAVSEPENDFYLNNRGIVISAKELIFDTSKSTVTIDLGNQDNDDDKFSYGILDGAHTYRAIIENRKNIANDQKKYVRVEVIKNVQNITRLSDARNTSVQVSDIALFNLDDKFDNIKEAISKEAYADQIAYKDNEDKELHVYELLRLMYALDKDKYPDDTSAPIQSYSGKAQVFKRYKSAYDTDFYRSLTTHLPTLVNLFDTIEKDLPERYKEYKRNLGTANPRFGAVRGIECCPADKSYYTSFLHNETPYNISSGYIYPIFGAFRFLINFNEETKKVNWLFDPIEIWNEVGTALVQNTFETWGNPNLAGKDKQLWLSNYRIVETQSLRKLLNHKI
ncbi:MAG: abortive phage infection protein [Lachnospiraceae bacterium]|nr:abortive phage infection protein [Lachnospiraceae bacterium]